jgi:hypothetical protein
MRQGLRFVHGVKYIAARQDCRNWPKLPNEAEQNTAGAGGNENANCLFLQRVTEVGTVDNFATKKHKINCGEPFDKIGILPMNI